MGKSGLGEEVGAHLGLGPTFSVLVVPDAKPSTSTLFYGFIDAPSKDLTVVSLSSANRVRG